MRTIPRGLLCTLFAFAAALLGGCSFPNAATPGVSSVAVDGTANQVWLVSTGKLYRCSVNGSALGCTEATTNIPK